MYTPDMDRTQRHARHPMVREQIAALLDAARFTGEQAEAVPSSAPAPIGLVLTSNMLAGFALELGLKLFYMTYRNDGPPRNTHDLLTLFEALPPKIQADVAALYERTPKKDRIRVYALITSPTQPNKPTVDPSKGYADAPSAFESASKLFVQSRYFYETVTGDDWSIIDHPFDSLIALGRALITAYSSYERQGGFGADIL
ncbi:MAG: hypothetical protein ACT4OF_15940 [Caulobacteraceae bacterium]